MDVDDLEVAQDEGNKEAIVQMILDLASACSIGGARGGGWQANPLIPERIDSCNSGVWRQPRDMQPIQLAACCEK